MCEFGLDPRCADALPVQSDQGPGADPASAERLESSLIGSRCQIADEDNARSSIPTLALRCLAVWFSKIHAQDSFITQPDEQLLPWNSGVKVLMRTAMRVQQAVGCRGCRIA